MYALFVICSISVPGTAVILVRYTVLCATDLLFLTPSTRSIVFHYSCTLISLLFRFPTSISVLGGGASEQPLCGRILQIIDDTTERIVANQRVWSRRGSPKKSISISARRTPFFRGRSIHFFASGRHIVCCTCHAPMKRKRDLIDAPVPTVTHYTTGTEELSDRSSSVIRLHSTSSTSSTA